MPLTEKEAKKIFKKHHPKITVDDKLWKQFFEASRSWAESNPPTALLKTDNGYETNLLKNINDELLIKVLSQPNGDQFSAIMQLAYEKTLIEACQTIQPELTADPDLWKYFLDAYGTWKKGQSQVLFNSGTFETEFLKNKNINHWLIKEAYNSTDINNKENILNKAFLLAYNAACEHQIEFIKKTKTTITPEIEVENYHFNAVKIKPKGADQDEATDNVGEAVEAASDVIDNALSITHHHVSIKTSPGLHVVDVATSALNVITIPAVYIYQLVRGQPVSFNLPNNAKWAAGAVLLTLAVVGFAVPAVGVAMLVASAAFAASVAVVSLVNLYRDRQKLTKGLDEINKQMKEQAVLLRVYRDSANTLQQSLNTKTAANLPFDLGDTFKLEKLNGLNEKYTSTQNKLEKLASQHKTISAAQKELITPFSKASNIIGLVLAGAGIAAAILAFPWAAPAVASILFITLAAVGGVLVVGAIGKFIHDYRAKKKAEMNPIIPPHEELEVTQKRVDDAKKTLDILAHIIKKDPKNSTLNADQRGQAIELLTQPDRIKEIGQQLKFLVDEANSLIKPHPKSLIKFFVEFAQKHKDDNFSKDKLRPIFEELPPKIRIATFAALQKAIAKGSVSVEDLSTLKEFNKKHKEIFGNYNPGLKSLLALPEPNANPDNHPAGVKAEPNLPGPPSSSASK